MAVLEMFDTSMAVLEMFDTSSLNIYAVLQASVLWDAQLFSIQASLNQLVTFPYSK